MESAPPQTRAPGPSILLAEDEPDIARLASFKLEREGFRVSWVQDGPAALERLRTIRPDLVLLDVMMPGMDGYQVLAAIMADPALSRIPVILLSARGQREEIERGLERGAVAYIVKPFPPAELVRTIRQVLGRRDAPSAGPDPAGPPDRD